MVLSARDMVTRVPAMLGWCSASIGKYGWAGMTNQPRPSLYHAAVCVTQSSQSTRQEGVAHLVRCRLNAEFQQELAAQRQLRTHQGSRWRCCCSTVSFFRLTLSIAASAMVKEAAWPYCRMMRQDRMAFNHDAAERRVKQRRKIHPLRLRTCNGRRNASSRLTWNRCWIQKRPATSPVTKPVTAAPRCRNVRPIAISIQLVTKQSTP